MEILLGVSSSIVAELFKVFSKKYGEEVSKKIIHGFVLTIVLIFTTMINRSLISAEAINSFLQIFSSSYTTYNIIIKNLKK